MKPPMTTKYTTIINIIFNIFIKTVGSSVIFLLSVIRISHKSLLNQ